MNQKLYVGGLNAATNDARLREVFAEYGEITQAKVITHRDTGASRGFAFVIYNPTKRPGRRRSAAGTAPSSTAATITVNVARPRVDNDRGR